MFVAQGAKLNQVDPDTGIAPLHQVARSNHSRLCCVLAAQVCIIQLFSYTAACSLHYCYVQDGIDINAIDRHKVTPLHYAAITASWRAVECLVGWGAKVNAVDSKGDTPLHDVMNRKSPVLPESPRLQQVNHLCKITVQLL